MLQAKLRHFFVKTDLKQPKRPTEKSKTVHRIWKGEMSKLFYKKSGYSYYHYRVQRRGAQRRGAK